MKKHLYIICAFYLLLIIPGVLFAKFIELSGGNASLDFAHVFLDNKPAIDTIFSRYPGYNGRFNIYTQGKAFNRSRDFNSIIDVTFSDNLQTKNYINNILLQFKKPDDIITLGDVYTNFNRLSLMNTRVRGLQFERAYHFTYPDEVLLSRSNNAENEWISQYDSPDKVQHSISDYYLQETYVRPFSTTRVWLLGGITRLKADPGTGSQFGIYRQFGWGARLETNPTSSSRVGFAILQGKDDENSVDRAIASDNPFTNRLLSSDFDINLFKGKTAFSSIYSYSDYDEDIFDDEPTKNDYAYEFRLKQKIGSWALLEGYFAHLGADFFTIGNPYLSIDKKGYKVMGRLNPTKDISSRVDFERYHDNVNKTKTTTLEVNDLNTSTKIKMNHLPKLTFGFKLNQKQSSDKTTDNKKTTYEAQFSEKYGGVTWIASSNYIKFRDDVLTSSADTSGLALGSRSANEYRAKSGSLYLSKPFFNERLIISVFGSQSNFNFFNAQSKSEFLSGNGKIDAIIMPDKLTSTTSVDFTNSVTDNISQVKTITGKHTFKYIISPDRSLKINYIGVKSNYLEQQTAGDLYDYVSHTVGFEYALIF